MFGKGVVGISYFKNEVIVVKNVYEIENYIICDLIFMLEIVILIRYNGVIWVILDLDSLVENRFDKDFVDFL